MHFRVDGPNGIVEGEYFQYDDAEEFDPEPGDRDLIIDEVRALWEEHVDNSIVDYELRRREVSDEVFEEE